MPKQIFLCEVCSAVFYAYVSSHRRFCSKKCMGTAFSGPENPNYNNNWSDEQKQTQSNLIKSKVDDTYRKNCAKANKGKKFSVERIHAMHGHRSKSSYMHAVTEETKRKIGIKSKAKFTPEYWVKVRKVMENAGYWDRLEDKTDREIYYKLSNWVHNMFHLVTEQDQLILLRGFKVFNPITNHAGVVRDHMFSRNSGYKNGVFPELLHHPANCEIILHRNNAAKRTGRYIDEDSQTIDQLFSRIEHYQGEWDEQDICIQLIQKYRNGDRWER